MSSEPLKKCPECKKNKLQKLIGAGAAVIVKGTQTPCYDRTRQKKEKLDEQKKVTKETAKKNPPWWRSRKDKKIDTKVLKNSEKYILTGEKD